MDRLEVLAGALAALVAAVAGCSQGVASNPRWGAGAATAGVSSNRLVAGALAPVPLDIEITSPPPASWLASADVTIAGVVRNPEPSRVSRVTVGGVPAILGAAGEFQARVRLGTGISPVTVHVTDRSGIVTATTASYMVGPVRPLADPVGGAVAARLDASAFGMLGAVVGDALDQVDFDAVLVPLSPIPVASPLNGAIQVELDILSADHGRWTATVTPGPGALLVTAEVPDVKARLVLHTPSGSPIPVSLPGEATTRLARATSTATLVTSRGGPARVVVAPPAVELRGTAFAVQGPASGPVASSALALVQQRLTSVLETALSQVLESSLPSILECELAKVTSPPPTRIGGVAFTFSATPARFDVSPSAAVLVADGDVTAPVGTGMTAAPGFLTGAGPTPVLGPGRGLSVAISPELLSKATTVAWQSGALNLDVDARAWAQLGAGLPPLDARGFSQLLPELASVLPAGTPLVLRLRPRLPPRLVVAPGPSVVTLELGELHLEVWADLSNGTLVPALDLTVHGAVPLAPSVGGNALAFARSPIRPRFFFSVAKQPLVRVDAAALQTRLSIVLDALLPSVLATVPIALPKVRGKSLSNVRFSAEGALLDHLVIAGDL